MTLLMNNIIAPIIKNELAYCCCAAMLLLLTNGTFATRSSEVQNQINSGVKFEDVNFGLQKKFGWWKWSKMHQVLFTNLS